MPNVILASKSPRRAELLSRLGLHYAVISVDADETFPAELSPAEIVKYIAQEKARAVMNFVSPDDVIITADTMVFLDDKKLGKPETEEDAFLMLSALAGREHLVCTGVSVMQNGQILTEAEETRVRFAALDEDTIRAYIRSGEPMDKAGAYGVQGLGALLVEGISGDYFNVMGLPLRRLSLMLEQFGVKVLT